METVEILTSIRKDYGRNAIDVFNITVEQIAEKYLKKYFLITLNKEYVSTTVHSSSI